MKTKTYINLYPVTCLFILSILFLHSELNAETTNSLRGKSRVIEMKVNLGGFEPDEINVKAGEKIKLRVTRTSDDTCATEILIPKLNIKKELPLNKAVDVTVGPLPAGDFTFGCGMSLMVRGVIHAAP